MRFAQQRCRTSPKLVPALDRSNALTSGLTVALLPVSGNAPIDLAQGLSFLPQGGTQLAASVGGLAWDVATAGTDGQQATIAAPAYPISLGVVFVPGVLGSSVNLLNICNSTVSNTTSRIGLQIGTDTVEAYTRSSAAAISVSTSPNAPTVGGINVAVGRFASNAARVVYLNGLAGAAEATARAAAGIDTMCVGSAAGTTRQDGQVGRYLLAVMWRRALSAGEAVAFTLNPWQVFLEARSMRCYLTAIAAGMAYNPMTGRLSQAVAMH